LHRIAGTADISAIRTLANVVEPVKDYTRPDNLKGQIDFHAPLNRLVDAAYPESNTARHFGDLVQVYVQSGYKDQAVATEIRALLTVWRDNDAKLRPLLSESFLLQEDAPLSEYLSALGVAGLQALDYLDKAEPSPDSWRTQQLPLLEQAKKQQADLLLMVVSPVQQLIEASGHASR
jgi:hexosaminidase